MKSFVCVLSVLLLASCSNEWAAGLADRPTTADRAIPSTAGDAATPSSTGTAVHDRGARAFASAPDRGSLVQYPQTAVVRRSGAYTFHAADLSEEHALHATVTGDLSFAAPDGTQIRLVYERHVEHPDGNWSWIGRAAGARGESTVITFGETAVFGTIPQGSGKPDLRLTVADGRTWVVTADPLLLREIRNEATHPTRPDFLLPGYLATAVGASAIEMDVASTSAESDTITAAATVNGNTIVDVLVGFTDGYARYRGGDLAAITRVHNLVDISNQAFANSQVAVRARLVHSMKIGYPDATANKTALEEMTGFQAPSTRTTPSPAFSALRSARDQFGADLVVLLRRFQEPENGSCGVAWLIGGGLSGIASSDQYFGYSVVSDGQDAGTDGKTYFCREETFAHELGHNMGSQHDSENAKKDDGSVSYGAFRYSFGWKPGATAGDFITVMAGGDSGETRYRVFSNPNVSICGGLACGVADQADNARSLRATAPAIASFRATVVPLDPVVRARHDIDGDGNSDLLFLKDSALAYWKMNGATVEAGPYVGSEPTGYRLVAAGDFNGDGLEDLAWASASRIRFWINAGGGKLLKSSLVGFGGGWTPFAASDIDGDGKDDLLFRNGTALALWKMDGMTVVASQYVGDAGLGYRVIAIGDLNNNHSGDLIWASTNRVLVWVNNGVGGFSKAPTIAFGGGWQPFAMADINGDGKSDLLFRSGSAVAYWQMNGAIVESSKYLGDGGDGYRVVATGDFNGDGRDDISWGNGGNIRLWTSSGSSSFAKSSAIAYGGGWVPYDPGIVP